MFDSLTNWFKCHRTPSPSSQVLASPVSETPTSPPVAPVAADPSSHVDVEGEKGEKRGTDALKEKWFVRCFGGIKKCCGFGKGTGCPCGFGCKSEKKKEVDVVVKEDGTKEKKPIEQIEVSSPSLSFFLCHEEGTVYSLLSFPSSYRSSKSRLPRLLRVKILSSTILLLLSFLEEELN